MNHDPYSILGVSRTASDDEIKKAYRQKAKAFHPDLHPGDTAKAEQFKQISCAFDILSDSTKRGQYDRGEIDGEGQPKGFASSGFGNGGFNRGGHNSAGAGARGSMGGGHGDPFEDILSGIFGGGGSAGSGRSRRGPGPRKGRDIRYHVDIAFADAITGARRRMKMSDGQVLDLKIPAGIEHGQTLRLKSQGPNSAYGGPPGDALVEVRVKDDKRWTRDGDDVRMAVPISLETAVLGGTVDVETPCGPLSLKVPEGSNTGAILRLRGKGVQRSTKPGHLYARLEMVLDNPRNAALRDFVKKSSAR